ncbi:16887_t:CDS:2, partial [Racocetra fulgida]
IPTKATPFTRNARISNNLDNMTNTKDWDILNSKDEKHQTGIEYRTIGVENNEYARQNDNGGGHQMTRMEQDGRRNYATVVRNDTYAHVVADGKDGRYQKPITESYGYGVPTDSNERYSTTRMEDNKRQELKRQTTGRDTEYQGGRIQNSRDEQYKTSRTEDNKYQEREVKNRDDRYRTEIGDNKYKGYEKLSSADITYQTIRMGDTKQQEGGYLTIVTENTRHKVLNDRDVRYTSTDKRYMENNNYQESEAQNNKNGRYQTMEVGDTNQQGYMSSNRNNRNGENQIARTRDFKQQGRGHQTVMIGDTKNYESVTRNNGSENYQKRTGNNEYRE